MSDETKFKVGDKVSWDGLKGKVVSVEYGHVYPIEVRFDTPEGTAHDTFTRDGRFYREQDPSLKLVERPKTYVDRTMWQAIRRSMSGDLYIDDFLHKTIEQAYGQLDSVGATSVCISISEEEAQDD